MLSYVLFLYSAFDFPIRTLWLLHSFALFNSHCTSFAFVLSGFSANTAFSVSLSFPVLSNTCPETPVAKVTQALSTELSTWKDRLHIDVPDDAAALATLFTVRPIS